jgi:hypothetical protein
LLLQSDHFLSHHIDRANLSDRYESFEPGEFVRIGLGKSGIGEICETGTGDILGSGEIRQNLTGEESFNSLSLLAKICPNNHPYYF